MVAGRGGPSGQAGLPRADASLSALTTAGLTKRYGDLAAVAGLDLSVAPGELYGFLGPNGAGKTTTIRMALGLIFPTAGEVRVLGEPVFASERASARNRMFAAPGALRRVGALVEEPGFWKYLSGRRNLELFARAAGPRSDAAARVGRVDQVLRLVGLAEAAGKKVKAYSQGMRQRLGVGLALLGAPQVLILDEPTNGLDPQGMREVRLLLRRLADEGTTVFVSSHLLWEVEAVCDRVGVLARGRLVAEGPPGELRTSGGTVRVDVDDPERARLVLAAFPAGTVLGEPAEPHDGWRPGAGTLRVRIEPPATPADLNAALVSAGVRVSVLVPERASLEEVFLSLVEGADAPR